MDFKLQVTQYFKNLQNHICAALEQVDGLGKFKEDVWERPEGGGGRSRVMELGNVIDPFRCPAAPFTASLPST